MQGSRVLGAQLSQAVYVSKRSFEKELDSLPTTAFQYYYHSKIKELQSGSNDFHNTDILSCGQHNNAFRRFIRKEWNSLSTTKKRLYYAFFFHFTGVDHTSLNKYELARILEIQTPAISDYMLFRNKFKYKFDNVWYQEREQRSRKRRMVLKHNPIGFGHTITISSRISVHGEESFSLTAKFQKMCRECRHTWNQKITEEQKLEIRNIWEEQKRQFDTILATEREALGNNLNRLSKMNLDSKVRSLKVDRYTTRTIASSIVIPYKKK